MKKSMLCAGLITILWTTVYAKDSDQPVSINDKNVKLTAPTLVNTTPQAVIATSDAIQTPTAPGTQTPATPGVQTPAASETKTLTAPGVQAPLDPGVPTPATPGTPTPSIPIAPTTPSVPTPTTPSVPTPATPSVPTPATPSVPTPATPSVPTPTTPSAPTPTTPSAPTPATPSTPTPATPAKAPQPLNCNYRIPAETNIEQEVVMKWAEKAAEQSFDFDHNMIDKQLLDLKACYTDQGWQGFNEALQKSGNLNAIKSQKLIVSSMVTGEGKITPKDNQWKVTLPMQVVYQNDKEKLTQTLTVNLVIGRKISGDLGIIQVIALPHKASAPQVETPATTPTSSSTTPAAPSKP